MKQTAATQKQVLDKQFLVASKNEQGRENELYGSGRRLSMSDEDYNKLQDELHKIRIENVKLLGTNEALEKYARDDQKTQTEMLKRLENGQAELQRSVHHNTRQIEEVKDGVDETKLLVHQHMALLEGTHESFRNNMRRITNMLDTEVAVPNLIVVVPAPEKARRTGWTTPNLSSLFELSKLLQQKSMDLHIICPLTRKIAVPFEVSKPAAFAKENAGLIKLGVFALKAGNVALKIAAKLGTGLDISLDTSEIDTFIEGVNKLNEEFSDVSGVDVKETVTEIIITETVAMREYFEGERGDVHLEQEKSREMKKLTGKSYENLKSFLDQRNRMSEVRKYMEVIVGKDNQKMCFAIS
ncbi:hypothetical protein TL16_g10980 [Triparma laevis f. inornata]|uniref:Uncharacterized protein n=1 Tax=Triparma laevis f. inornata TaxID=1714386 RepID=A0A9W7BH73_9STRA|nr:hypothetical protein TL16_g10980 [Triparma laevis f. inornata]